MTLNRWDPLRDLLNFQERMNRFVEIRTQKTLFQRSAVWSPLVDMLETPDAYIFRAELPGVGKKKHKHRNPGSASETVRRAPS